MTDSLALTVAQPAVRSGDVASNAIGHAAVIRRAAPSRVVVFPELSLTGYQLDAEAVDPADDRLRPLVEACRDTGAVALAGAPTTGPTGDRLSILAIDGETDGCGQGIRVVYDKMFLGGDEPDRFGPGTEPAVIEIDGWRLGLAICRDTGVADHAALTAALGLDAYLAGVCEHETDRPVIGERAERIATGHRVWVGVASFAGSTGHGYGPAAGGSGIWRPDGGIVEQAGPEVGRSVRAVLHR